MFRYLFGINVQKRNSLSLSLSLSLKNPQQLISSFSNIIITLFVKPKIQDSFRILLRLHKCSMLTLIQRK